MIGIYWSKRLLFFIWFWHATSGGVDFGAFVAEIVVELLGISNEAFSGFICLLILGSFGSFQIDQLFAVSLGLVVKDFAAL